jgi:hypothetical protein
MNNHKTATELVEAWDRGEIVWTISMGGLGPGYEQALQIAAVEFARAGKDMSRTENDKADAERFDGICSEVMKTIDDKLGGLSGAQYGAAKWLAW